MRIGIDLGGTKIAGIVLAGDGQVLASARLATPAGDYAATVAAVAGLVRRLESGVGSAALPVGIGMPGSLSHTSGLVRNANSICLNGRPFKRDLEAALRRTVFLANDANCLATSESADGAAAGAQCVFGVILGTGVGGGIALHGRARAGRNAIAGEWGHNPLPWADASELPGPRCWCGRHGCIETWLSGAGLLAANRLGGGKARDARAVVVRAQEGNACAVAALTAYQQRLARALASIINVVDPDVIVCGGGLSRIQSLYEQVPRLWGDYVFSDHVETRFVPAMHGAASGVRGAARLAPLPVDSKK